MSTRIPFPAGVPTTTRRYPRTLDQRPPHLRSDSVCIVSATSADAAKIAAQTRAERIFMACLILLLLIAAPFIWGTP